jgi:hypothetical protein
MVRGKEKEESGEYGDAEGTNEFDREEPTERKIKISEIIV